MYCENQNERFAAKSYLSTQAKNVAFGVCSIPSLEALGAIIVNHQVNLPPSSGHTEKLNVKLKKEVCPCQRKVEENTIMSLRERQSG